MPTLTPPHAKFKRKRPSVALATFIFSRTRYLKSAEEHDIAVCLNSADVRFSYDQGRLGPEWEQAIKDQARLYAASLSTSIWGPFRLTAIVMMCVLAACVALGAVRPDLSFSLQGCVISTAAVLGLWAGMLQLYPPVQTYKGACLHEEVHIFLTKVLVALAAAGGLFASLM